MVIDFTLPDDVLEVRDRVRDFHEVAPTESHLHKAGDATGADLF